MLEEDYLALENNANFVGEGLASSRNNKISNNHNGQTQGLSLQVNKMSSQITKELILPKIEEEVNYGKNFPHLRQIYNSLILATWFKQRLRLSDKDKSSTSTLTSAFDMYIDKKKIKGVNVDDPQIKQKIYNQYLEAYKKGVYNYIKADYDPTLRKNIRRKYYSGGMGFAGNIGYALIQLPIAKHTLPNSSASSALAVKLLAWGDGKSVSSSSTTNQNIAYDGEIKNKLWRELSSQMPESLMVSLGEILYNYRYEGVESGTDISEKDNTFYFSEIKRGFRTHSIMFRVGIRSESKVCNIHMHPLIFTSEQPWFLPFIPDFTIDKKHGNMVGIIWGDDLVSDTGYYLTIVDGKELDMTQEEYKTLTDKNNTSLDILNNMIEKGKKGLKFYKLDKTADNPMPYGQYSLRDISYEQVQTIIEKITERKTFPAEVTRAILNNTEKTHFNMAKNLPVNDIETVIKNTATKIQGLSKRLDEVIDNNRGDIFHELQLAEARQKGYLKALRLRIKESTYNEFSNKGKGEASRELKMKEDSFENVSKDWAEDNRIVRRIKSVRFWAEVDGMREAVQAASSSSLSAEEKKHFFGNERGKSCFFSSKRKTSVAYAQ